MICFCGNVENYTVSSSIIKKAFDSVWRIGLWPKLIECGVNGKLFNVIKNLYSEIKSCVRVDGVFSDYFVSFKGLRQGENLSPLLFALFVNDLEKYLLDQGCTPLNFGDDILNTMSLFVLLYVDDTVILSDNKANLQHALDHLSEYCREWKLEVNPSKTKVIVFSRRKPKPAENVFMFNGTLLDVVDSMKYLGVTFKFNNNFNACLTNLHDQSQKAMYALLGRASKLNLDICTQIELFDKMVAPICTYGCEVWGSEKCDTIEKVHVKFLKYLLRVKTSTSNVMVYGETGSIPLIVTIKLRMINFWMRIVTGKQEKLTRIMYSMLLTLFKNNTYKSPWLSYIKSILDNCGLSYVWDSQDKIRYFTNNMSAIDKLNMINVNFVKNSVKNNTRDQFIQKWRAEVNASENCCLYKCFKLDFECERYLYMLPNKLRIAVCKFRMANTKLPLNKVDIPMCLDICDIVNCVTLT